MGCCRAPLRELGADPITGAPILLKDGRFGPYVTDGVTNASLRKGDSVDDLTSDRAAELLADRRAAGPRPPRARKAAGGAREVRRQYHRRLPGRRQRRIEEGSGEEGGGEEGGGAKKAAAKKGQR